jgi:diguanylate cyclase (GGDEF)-like protein
MPQHDPKGLSKRQFANKNNEGVVDIAKYKNTEEKTNSESSAFAQVMSQMNIADRAAFDVQYDKYWQQASDNGELLSILICEIDYFDNYKEHYGQQGSAFMLLVIGLALKNTCEKFGCYLAHYRGDEFAIIIKGGTVDAAQEVAELLRVAVEESRTEHKHSKVSDVVTLSIGLSSVFPTSMNVLMQKSVEELNTAKNAGRNQVSGGVDLKNLDSGLITQDNDKITKESIERKIKNETLLKEHEQSDFERMLSELEIYNRLDFNSYFVCAWQESKRDKDLLSMIICELDFFDEYRQHYSKQVSEDILLIIASTMQNLCEELSCFVAHLEGSKFVVLIKDGNATRALKIAESLHSSIKELEMEHPTSPVSHNMTMSMGLSSIFPSEDNSMKSLMKKVDSALSDAKSSGYDQISVS